MNPQLDKQMHDLCELPFGKSVYDMHDAMPEFLREHATSMRIPRGMALGIVGKADPMNKIAYKVSKPGDIPMYLAGVYDDWGYIIKINY